MKFFKFCCIQISFKPTQEIPNITINWKKKAYLSSLFRFNYNLFMCCVVGIYSPSILVDYANDNDKSFNMEIVSHLNLII